MISRITPHKPAHASWLRGTIATSLLANAALLAGLIAPIRIGAAPPPAVQPSDPFTFAVVGDNRGGTDGVQPRAFHQIIQAVAEAAPQLVLHTGDMINGKTDDLSQARAWWKLYRAALAPLSMPIYHVPGNHDIWNEPSARLYRELWGPSYYARDAGRIRFLGLDTETDPSRLGAAQLDWLNRQLQDPEPRVLFLFFHRPLFPVDGAKGSSLDVYPEERDRLHRLLVQHRARIKGVFQGHEHLYHYGMRDGVPYYITGGSGANLYLPPELGGFHHFLLVRVTGNDATVELRKVGPGSSPRLVPIRIRPGQLLEGWEEGLNWYTWDYTVTSEITATRASHGERALRLNFDLAQNAWPVLSLPHLPTDDWDKARGFTIDLFLPPGLAVPFTLTPSVEGEQKWEATPVLLRPGWNSIRADLALLRPANRAGEALKSIGWTLTSDDHSVRGWVLFDQFRLESGPGKAAHRVLESWESSHFWRAFDESVTAEPARTLHTEGQRGLRVDYDFAQCEQPQVVTRLNPAWDLIEVGSLSAEVFLPETISSGLSASLALRSEETEYAAPLVPLQSGWNKVPVRLKDDWLPARARRTVDQVQWGIVATNRAVKGWVVWDNFRADD